jgi:hyperosmotically inducible protein
LQAVHDSGRVLCVYIGEPPGDEGEGREAMTRAGRGTARQNATLVGLLGGLLVAAPALAGDADVQKRVRDRLTRAGLDQRGAVEVSVKDGVVALEGFTLTVDARRDAERAAGKESERVDNRLVVRPAAPLSDAKVGQAVVDAILREPRYGVFDSVGVAVEDGVVRLVGSVRQPWLKDALDRRVANLDGVRDIHNEIRVAPTSTFDDRLRAELVRRIYGDDMFARYANWAHPPIRIVVENGRVTLTGAVGSPVEQVRLGMIARGTLSFGVVNEVEVEGGRSREAVQKAPQS